MAASFEGKLLSSFFHLLIRLLTIYNKDKTYVHSDWSKSHALSEYKTKKKRVLLFLTTLPYYKANEET